MANEGPREVSVVQAAAVHEVSVAEGTGNDLSATIRDHAQFVRLTLQRLGLRHPDLDDAFQDVFLVVQRRLHTWDRQRDLRAWLFGVCANVARKARASAHRRRECSLEADPHAADAGAPDRQLVRAQARARLLELLDQLDDDRRIVFVMFEIDQIDCSVIARTLGVPLGTVYSRLHAARRDMEKAARQMRLRDAREAREPHGR